MSNFECDKPGRHKLIDYLIKKGKEKGFDFTLDLINDNNEKAVIDIKFRYTKNGKEYFYSIEMKERRMTYQDFKNKYPDVMFEENKIDALMKDNKMGYRTYFFNLFYDDKVLVYNITKDTKYQTGLSYQSPTTVVKKSKEWLPKIYLKYKDGKLIDLNE